MPNETDYLISPGATDKKKIAQPERRGAEIVVLDDRRPPDTWHRLDFIIARLGLLARGVDLGPEIIVHSPPRERRR